jgi:ribonuclease PH
MLLDVCYLFAGERRRRGKADRRSTELSKVIRNTLEQTICVELLPRSQIDICVQVGLLCNMFIVV